MKNLQKIKFNIKLKNKLKFNNIQKLYLKLIKLIKTRLKFKIEKLIISVNRLNNFK